MKRRSKILFPAMVLIVCGTTALILAPMVRDSAEPFPGAAVVLDDESWKSRGNQDWANGGYVWATFDTLLYKQPSAKGYQVILRHILPNRNISSPQRLPIFLTEEQEAANLASNGSMLCINNPSFGIYSPYEVVQADGKGKPIAIKTKASQVFWSPDNRYLYAMPYETSAPIVERYDAQTGSVKQTLLNTQQSLYPSRISPKGNLLCIDDYSPKRTGNLDWSWTITEVQGKNVVTATYYKHFPFSHAVLSLSPDGKRLLWAIHDEENSLWEKWQEKLFRKQIAPHKITRWQVTDRDGSNERWIGIARDRQQEQIEAEPKWTPDSKGVHFLQEGKLVYLAVP